LLQGTIPDFSARRVCNTQRINILTGAGKRSTSGVWVEVSNPVFKVVQLRDRDVCETALIGAAEQENGRDDRGQRRGERVIVKLRNDHLNSGEEKSLHEQCFDYQDIFFLPGDKLICTIAGRHTTQLEPGVTHKYTTLPTTRKSTGRGRPTIEAAT
jgi:hypothetical protein